MLYSILVNGLFCFSYFTPLLAIFSSYPLLMNLIIAYFFNLVNMIFTGGIFILSLKKREVKLINPGFGKNPIILLLAGCVFQKGRR